jgi:hypothetical protein
MLNPNFGHWKMLFSLLGVAELLGGAMLQEESIFWYTQEGILSRTRNTYFPVAQISSPTDILQLLLLFYFVSVKNVLLRYRFCL